MPKAKRKQRSPEPVLEREILADDCGFRAVRVTAKAAAAGTPSTLDEKARSVECGIMTENPVRSYIPSLGYVVEEVVLLDGMRTPPSGQVVLLDSHSQYGAGSVLGSVRDLHVEAGTMVGRAVFSAAPEAESPWTKVREGHLTDFSGGYRRLKTVWIEDGKTMQIGTRTFVGPVSVCTESELVEVSVTPIGADRETRTRSAESVVHHPGGDAGKQETEGAEDMNEAIRKMLVAAGMKPEATEEEALRFLNEVVQRSQTPAAPVPATPKAEGQAAAPAAPKTDVEAIRAEGARLEQDRQVGIRKLVELVSLDEAFSARMITENKPLEEAQRLALEELAKRKTPQIVVTREAVDAYRAAAVDAIAYRGGLKLEKPAAGHDELAGLTLREMARDCLRRANQSDRGDIRDVIGRALTTSDFPYILAAVSNKAVMEGWATAEETYSAWVDDSGSVSDFKTATLVRASEFPSLEQIKEGGEYKHAAMSETREQYQIVTYGKLIVISRQTIINDDVGALTDIPRKMGDAAARKVGDLPYNVLSANAAMGDGVVLFHTATHGNLAGSGAVISSTTYDAGRVALASMKDLDGSTSLNIKPAFYVAGEAKMATAETFFQSIYKDASNQQANIFQNVVKRVYESRITGNEWYLMARKGKTVKLFFLNGVKTPYIEQKTGWTTDGTEMKVRIDAAAKALDWRGMYQNPGA